MHDSPTGAYDTAEQQRPEFHRQLGLFDSSMIVIGAIVGSGIFIVPAGMTRTIGSPGGLMAAWLLTCVLTVGAAAIYSELSSALPGRGGMYAYLRECFSPLAGFLYGWTFFTVIQTGSIAAVAVAFARFSGLFWLSIAERNYLIAPIHLTSRYAVSLSTTQLVAIGVIVVLSATNALGLRYGKWVQNVLTLVKIASLAGLIVTGIVAAKRSVMYANFTRFFSLHPTGTAPEHFIGIAALAPCVAICVTQSGSLFSADSWLNVAFASEEVQQPRRTLPRALILGSTLVVGIYLCVNLVYLCNLNLADLANAPQDRVATSMMRSIFARSGGSLMSAAIMVSTFGCINALVLAGARAHSAMARDGLFFAPAGRLNRQGVPGWSLLLQAVWAVGLLLVTPTRRSQATPTMVKTPRCISQGRRPHENMCATLRETLTTATRQKRRSQFPM